MLAETHSIRLNRRSTGTPLSPSAQTHTEPVTPSSESALPDSVRCVYEIIVSAPRLDEVREGMRVGIDAATSVDGVVEIHTANYGGKLGKGKIFLHSLFE